MNLKPLSSGHSEDLPRPISPDTPPSRWSALEMIWKMASTWCSRSTQQPPIQERHSVRPGATTAQLAGMRNPQLDFGNQSIIYNPATQKYIYLAEAPPIKNLVISGGGAKGVILPGVLKAFEEAAPGATSLREQLDNIAGSSVGALTATFIAVGMSSDALVDALGNQDFKKLLGRGRGPILKDGLPMTQFVRDNMETTITGHLESLCGKHLSEIKSSDITTLLQKRFLGEDLNTGKFNKIRSDISTLVANLKKEKPHTVRITFSTLHSLHELAPKVFKDLTVTATCRETGTTFYFDAERTPDLDIAEAGRASASLPIVLSPLKIDAKFLRPGYTEQLADREFLTFVDGGYLENIPVSVMQDKQGKTGINLGEQDQNLQTLALVFDETGTKQGEQSPFLDVKTKKHALYNSTKLKERLLRDKFAKFFAKISGNLRNTEKKEAGLEEIRQKYTQRNIPLAISIKTTDFKKAKKLQKELAGSGYSQAKNYLEIHKGEFVAREFDTLDDLLVHVKARGLHLPDKTALENFRSQISHLEGES